MSAFRCWYDGQPEPIGYPVSAVCPESAAADYVRDDKDVNVNDIESAPVMVLVREEHSMREAPRRINVTASIEVTIWGYPEVGASA